MSSIRQRRPLRTFTAVIALLLLATGFLGSWDPIPVSADTASVTVNVHLCDSDLSGLDVYQIAPLCQSQAVGYSVILDNGSGIQLNQPTDGSGLTTFSNLFPQSYYLWVLSQAPYGGVVAGCSQSDGVGNTVVPYQLMPLGGQFDVNFFFQADGYMQYCDFFLYQIGVLPPPTSGSVIVNKIGCPEGYDGYTGSIFDLAAECHDQPATDFLLRDVNGSTYPGSTPGSGINSYEWTNIPPGDFSVEEQNMQPGWGSRVFCKNEKLVGQGDAEEEVNVDNGTTAFSTLKPGYDFVWCDWFNISYTPNRVTIKVYKHACPDGYFSTSLSELAQTCQEPFDPVTFKLDGASSGNPGDQETGSVIPNGVQWSDLEGDTWYITEFIPAGYGEPLVFCKLISNDDLSESAQERVTVESVEDGYRITYDVAELYTLYCDWYNTQGTPYSGINLHKYGCPESYESSWGLNEFYQYCQTVVRDARFTVEGPNGYSNTQFTSGIDLAWEQIAPGEYHVAELQPSAWEGSVVYCALGTYNGSLGDYQNVDLDDNGFFWSLGSSEYLDCYWYNLLKPRPVVTVDPNAPATLVIVKYTCPEDYDPIARDAKPEDDCDDLTDGITFSVIGSQNASLTGETGDDGDGTVSFDGLRAGSYLLQESYPENVEQAFIWTCESDYRLFDYPFTPFARIDHTGTIKISLIAGETLTCDWYNVPTPPDEGTPSADGEVEVAVTVRECSGAVNANACDPVGEGLGVALSDVSGEGGPVDFETDEDGVAAISVAAGEYDIEADEPFCFSESDAFTSDGTLELVEGESVEVVLYICN